MGGTAAVATDVNLDADADPRTYLRDVRAALGLERSRTRELEEALEAAREERGDVATRLRFLGSGNRKTVLEARDAVRDAADAREENASMIRYLEEQEIVAYRRLMIHEHDAQTAELEALGETADAKLTEIDKVAGDLYALLREWSAAAADMRRIGYESAAAADMRRIGGSAHDPTRGVKRLLRAHLDPFLHPGPVDRRTRDQLRAVGYAGLGKQALDGMLEDRARKRAELEHATPPTDDAPTSILEADPSALSADDRHLRSKIERERRHLRVMRFRERYEVELMRRGVPDPVARSIARELHPERHEGADLDTLEALAGDLLERAAAPGVSPERAATAAAGISIPAGALVRAVEAGREKVKGEDAADVADSDSD